MLREQIRTLENFLRGSENPNLRKKFLKETAVAGFWQGAVVI
jgi:hypothetical protein